MKLPIETLREISSMMKSIPFMASLGMKEIEELAFAFNQRHFHKGQVIIKQGQKGDLFFLVYKGMVGVFKERFIGRKKLAELGPGNFFGEISLIENVPRTATVIAIDDSEVYTLSPDAFEKTLLSYPEIGQMIISTSGIRRKETESS